MSWLCAPCPAVLALALAFCPACGGDDEGADDVVYDGDWGGPGPGMDSTSTSGGSTADGGSSGDESTTGGSEEGSTGGGSDEGSSGEAEPIDPVAGASAPVLVATVGTFLEGPAWSDDEQALFFSATHQWAIHRFEPGGVPEVFANDTGSNGLAFSADGRLYVASAGYDEIRRYDALDGSAPQTLTADLDGHGFDFNQPNDLDVSADGTVYFSDPCFSCGEAPTVYGVYRWSDGALTREDEFDPAVENPNGVVLSPDQQWLYVAGAQDGTGVVWRYAVAGDGALGERQPFASLTGVGDGLAVDEAGNLYAASELGIEVFAPDGSRWGALGLDGLQDRAFNCAFGGADRQSLYVTAHSSLIRFDLPIAGAAD